jgi:hypothetical protein
LDALLYLVACDTHDSFELYRKLPVSGWTDPESHKLYVACIRRFEPIDRNKKMDDTIGIFHECCEEQTKGKWQGAGVP